jgi:ADP-heptose:LPS heptosyltransferase
MERIDSPRVIVVLCLSALGDFLNAIPVLQSLRANYPMAKLVVACEREGTAALARSCSLAEMVVLLPKGLRRNPLRFARAAIGLRGLKADLAIQTFASHGSCANLLIGATGAKVRGGFSDGHFQRLITNKTPLSAGVHYIDLNLTVLQAVGVENVMPPRGRFMPAIERHSTRFAPDIVASQYAPYVLMATGCDPALHFKRWSDDRWSELAGKVTATGLNVVFVGDRSEQERVAQIVAALPASKVWNLCGETDFSDLASLVSGAALAVGLDGMVMHLSAALDVPCVALFGPTDEKLNGPWGRLGGVVRANGVGSAWYTATSVGTTPPADAPDYMGRLDVCAVWEVVCKQLERGGA